KFGSGFLRQRAPRQRDDDALNPRDMLNRTAIRPGVFDAVREQRDVTPHPSQRTNLVPQFDFDIEARPDIAVRVRANLLPAPDALHGTHRAFGRTWGETYPTVGIDGVVVDAGVRQQRHLVQNVVLLHADAGEP